MLTRQGKSLNMTAPDLYAALDLPRDASADEAHAAYRRAAKSAHPDAGGTPDAWALVSLAHDVLTDEGRRARYDETGVVDDPTDNRVAQALQVLNGCLDDLLTAHQGQSTVLATDVVAGLRTKLDERNHKLHTQIAQFDRAIEVNRWFLGRFRRADEAPNMLEGLIGGRIAEFERRKSLAEQSLAIIGDAKALLEGYVFRSDVRPQAPTVSEAGLMHMLNQMATNYFVRTPGGW